MQYLFISSITLQYLFNTVKRMERITFFYLSHHRFIAVATNLIYFPKSNNTINLKCENICLTSGTKWIEERFFIEQITNLSLKVDIWLPKMMVHRVYVIRVQTVNIFI